jgi:hypothetical protein
MEKKRARDVFFGFSFLFTCFSHSQPNLTRKTRACTSLKEAVEQVETGKDACFMLLCVYLRWLDLSRSWLLPECS